MSREETAGGSLCEGIMEGSLRAVDRTMVHKFEQWTEPW